MVYGKTEGPFLFWFGFLFWFSLGGGAFFNVASLSLPQPVTLSKSNFSLTPSLLSLLSTTCPITQSPSIIHAWSIAKMTTYHQCTQRAWSSVGLHRTRTQSQYSQAVSHAMQCSTALCCYRPCLLAQPTAPMTGNEWHWVTPFFIHYMLCLVVWVYLSQH